MEQEIQQKACKLWLSKVGTPPEHYSEKIGFKVYCIHHSNRGCMMEKHEFGDKKAQERFKSGVEVCKRD